MLNEFKKFILKGNVVDLSTGVIIGAAFGGIVTAFTKGIVEPLLALVGGGGSPDLKIALTEAVKLDIGMIIGALISFLITAAVIFFIIVKPANKLMALMKKQEAAAPPPPTPEDIKLLTEIRDLLTK
jgi:large conductance mechanosensitive channel